MINPMKTIKLLMTIVAPAGLEKAKLIIIPAKKQTTLINTLEIVTLLKLLKNRMLLSAGKIIRLEIIIAPINLIPMTIVREVKIAISALNRLVLVPLVEEKVSSKVTAKI